MLISTTLSVWTTGRNHCSPMKSAQLTAAKAEVLLFANRLISGNTRLQLPEKP